MDSTGVTMKVLTEEDKLRLQCEGRERYITDRKTDEAQLRNAEEEIQQIINWQNEIEEKLQQSIALWDETEEKLQSTIALWNEMEEQLDTIRNLRKKAGDNWREAYNDQKFAEAKLALHELKKANPSMTAADILEMMEQ